jgi:hypothetical protein
MYWCWWCELYHPCERTYCFACWSDLPQVQTRVSILPGVGIEASEVLVCGAQ